MNKQLPDVGPDQEKLDISSDLENSDNAMVLTINLVRAYVTNHTVPATQLGLLLEQTHRTVLGLSNFRAEAIDATNQEDSVKPDCIMCLEDRKFFRSLKRHLAVRHGLTPEAYKARWNLPPDYPMVAPDYSQCRSKLALSMGFGGRIRRTGKRNGQE